MAKKISESIAECITSISRQPMLALLLIIFLTQSFIMVYKLDAINTTLMSIHEDNVSVKAYTINETQETKEFINEMEDSKNMLNLIYERVR